MPATERRLAAIMLTDIVGYTALMAESEEKGLAARERHRELVRPLVEQYHGESHRTPTQTFESDTWRDCASLGWRSSSRATTSREGNE